MHMRLSMVSSFFGLKQDSITIFLVNKSEKQVSLVIFVKTLQDINMSFHIP